MFWIAAALLAAIALLWTLGPLLARDRQRPTPVSPDVQVYRDQLAEIERDRARGVIDAQEAEASRAEIARRLLAADSAGTAAAPDTADGTAASDTADGTANAAAARAEPRQGPARSGRWAALGGVLFGLAGFAVIYLGTERLLLYAGASPDWVVAQRTDLVVALPLPFGAELVITPVYRGVGDPGRADLPLAQRAAQRPSQAEAEAVLVANGIDPAPEPSPGDAGLVPLIGQLREIVAARPSETRAYRFLARALGSIGHYAEAHRVQGGLILRLGAEATAQDHETHAELMILAAGEYVSPQAQRALGEALRRDPTLPRARYYAGLAQAQNGALREAYDIWVRLLQDGPPDAPWIAPIQAQIGPLAAAIGATLPDIARAPGPTLEQIEAARDLDPAEQAAMIQGMVDGLARRLAEEGGPPADWAQLIRALGVQGEPEKARVIWEEARMVFSGNPDGLALIDAAAREAGLDVNAP
ncbi:MAG: c-type cytochrome biogenesis protein CcmI [Pseudomonadota bacterium]